jgi:hypothetical protein
MASIGWRMEICASLPDAAEQGAFATLEEARTRVLSVVLDVPAKVPQVLL